MISSVRNRLFIVIAGMALLAVSIGIAAAPQQAHDRVALLRLADEALYRAKQAGRNRVAYASGEPDVEAAKTA